VPIAEILDDVLQLQGRQLVMSRITLDKKYFTDGEIRGFPVELRQVFLNLISNAIQAMPNGGICAFAWDTLERSERADRFVHFSLRYGVGNQT
jgi:signal transduction histidine kinase